MEFDKISTDNIYKFMAIAGLLMIVYAISFVWNKQENVRSELNSVKLESSKVDASLSILEADVDDLKEYSDILSKDSAQMQKEGILGQALQIMQNQHDLRVRLESVLHKKVEYEHKLQIVEELSKRLKVVSYLFMNLIYFGCIFSVLGFANWYLRIQIYNDSVIEKKFPKEIVLKNHKKLKIWAWVATAVALAAQLLFKWFAFNF
ncbi:MAG: hypothetical protein Q7S86_03935 [bacterium]|nr:hypothetical protein [bacterium]